MLTHFEPKVRRAALAAGKLDCHTALLGKLIACRLNARRHHNIPSANDNGIAEEKVFRATVDCKIGRYDAVALASRAEKTGLAPSVYRIDFPGLLHCLRPFCLAGTL